jgi:AraC family transcriptional activator of mtrCDE
MSEPATLDPLSVIAPLFRVRPEIQDVCRFALQWKVVHEAEPVGLPVVWPGASCD